VTFLKLKIAIEDAERVARKDREDKFVLDESGTFGFPCILCTHCETDLDDGPCMTCAHYV
jgi:hypothetical protein